MRLTKLISVMLMLCCGFVQPVLASSSFSLTSPDFEAQEMIPSLYTCQSANVSPALTWADAPPGTRSFALILEDPDAPLASPFVHWVLYNIPATATALQEDTTLHTLPKGSQQGLNSKQHTGYTGPCPPNGEHRYVFKLYALNTTLPHLHSMDKNHLLKAIDGKVVGVAILTGTYQRENHHV